MGRESEETETKLSRAEGHTGAAPLAARGMAVKVSSSWSSSFLSPPLWPLYVSLQSYSGLANHYFRTVLAPRGVVPSGSIPPAVAAAVALHQSSAFLCFLHCLDIVFVIISDLLQGQFPHQG